MILWRIVQDLSSAKLWMFLSGTPSIGIISYCKEGKLFSRSTSAMEQDLMRPKSRVRTEI